MTDRAEDDQPGDHCPECLQRFEHVEGCSRGPEGDG